MESDTQCDRLGFGPFELTSRPLGLLREGRVVALRPQALRLLWLFASRAGELVTHGEIREHVWGRRHVEFERGIHLLVAEIRQALGDTARHPGYLQTLPRQGYRFIARTARLRESAEANPAPGDRHLRWLQAARSAATLTVAAIGLLVLLGPWPARWQEPARPEAVAEYRKGAYLLERGTDEDLVRAAGYFGSALRLDPDYADPHVGLAVIARRQGSFDIAEAGARAALELRADHAPAHLELGLVAALRDWRWEDATGAIRRALELEPGLTEGHAALAAVFTVRGETEAALEASNRAYQSDAVSALIRVDHGWFHYYGGEFASAYRICGEVLALEPGNVAARICQYKAAMLSGARQQALDAARYLLAEWQAEGSVPGDAAAQPVLRSLDQFNAIRGARLEHLRRTTTVSPEACATAYAELGDFESAFPLLAKAAQRRSPNLPLVLRDPVFMPVADDPRFRTLLRDLGMPGRSWIHVSSLPQDPPRPRA